MSNGEATRPGGKVEELEITEEEETEEAEAEEEELRGGKRTTRPADSESAARGAGGKSHE